MSKNNFSCVFVELNCFQHRKLRYLSLLVNLSMAAILSLVRNVISSCIIIREKHLTELYNACFICLTVTSCQTTWRSCCRKGEDEVRWFIWNAVLIFSMIFFHLLSTGSTIRSTVSADVEGEKIVGSIYPPGHYLLSIKSISRYLNKT